MSWLDYLIAYFTMACGCAALLLIYVYRTGGW